MDKTDAINAALALLMFLVVAALWPERPPDWFVRLVE